MAHFITVSIPMRDDDGSEYITRKHINIDYIIEIVEIVNSDSIYKSTIKMDDKSIIYVKETAIILKQLCNKIIE